MPEGPGEYSDAVFESKRNQVGGPEGPGEYSDAVFRVNIKEILGLSFS